MNKHERHIPAPAKPDPQLGSDQQKPGNMMARMLAAAADCGDSTDLSVDAVLGAPTVSALIHNEPAATPVEPPISPVTSKLDANC